MLQAAVMSAAASGFRLLLRSSSSSLSLTRAVSLRRFATSSTRFGSSSSSSSSSSSDRQRQLLKWSSVGLTGAAFLGFYVWKESRLNRLEEEAASGRVGSDTSVGVGSSGGGLAVGGDFRLVDEDGNYKTLTDLTSNGKWVLLYFGFCHCPDVCPEQMEKMVEVVERLSLGKQKLDVTPVFISIDPERDTPPLVKEYIADFSDRFVGLTGKKAEVEAVAKKYRVYYSKGPVDQDGDYIVDHAIIMYLVNPQGQVCDYYGQTKSAKEIAACIAKVMQRWRPS